MRPFRLGQLRQGGGRRSSEARGGARGEGEEYGGQLGLPPLARILGDGEQGSPGGFKLNERRGSGGGEGSHKRKDEARTMRQHDGRKNRRRKGVYERTNNEILKEQGGEEAIKGL